MRGVGKVRFQLSHGGYLDQNGVLFVPGMRVNLLSVSALEDAGYSTLFWRGHVYTFPYRDDLGHVYIYLDRVGLIDPQLIGDWLGELYKFSVQPTVDDSDKEQEAPETTVAPRVQSRVLMEERESLLSTGRKLSQYEQTIAQDGRVESPRSSGFQVAARRLSSYSSSVQVVALVPGSQGAPTANGVMDLRTEPVEDGSEYLPC